MNYLQTLLKELHRLTKVHQLELGIDTIRVNFSKQHKKPHLDTLGTWEKVTRSTKISKTVKDKLKNEPIYTSAYKLVGENIFYYNYQDPPHYRKACLIIFGIKQYNKKSPSWHLIEKLLQIMKGIDSIDLCYDSPIMPNFELLTRSYTLTSCRTSRYINEPDIMMCERIILYDKQNKDKLDFCIWRTEFTILIPNLKVLALPILEIKEFIEKYCINDR